MKAPLDKILSLGSLSEAIAQEHLSGKKIVFTNGCFDLLHIGHVRYLYDARQLGDLLVIGLNSDESIRRLKGEKRPIIPQQQRAEMLGAFFFVDYVVIFEEDTPLQLIETLSPDVLVKGGDWAKESIVGADFVLANGGRVENIVFIEGMATTNIIGSVLEKYQQGENKNL